MDRPFIVPDSLKVICKNCGRSRGTHRHLGGNCVDPVDNAALLFSKFEPLEA